MWRLDAADAAKLDQQEGVWQESGVDVGSYKRVRVTVVAGSGDARGGTVVQQSSPSLAGPVISRVQAPQQWTCRTYEVVNKHAASAHAAAAAVTGAVARAAAGRGTAAATGAAGADGIGGVNGLGGEGGVVVRGGTSNSLLRPSPAYKGVIVCGAKEVGLPRAYLDGVIRRIVHNDFQGPYKTLSLSRWSEHADA